MTSDLGGASKKLNYHLKTNKNIDKGNQIITSSPIVEDKFQSKINININPNVNMKNNLSSFNNRFEKKPAPVN